MAEIAVIVPVLGRPHRAAEVAASLRAVERVDTLLVFVCTPSDPEQIDACHATGEMTLVTDWDGGRGDYARKINLALARTDEPYVFTGADDLRFTAGWDTTALRTFARGRPGVVGTVDRCNPRTRRARHSTHSLVSRAYAEQFGTADGDGIYHEGYWHNFCDDEMVATAVARGAYAACEASVVEHLHPMGGKAPDDATYRLGLSRFDEDRRLFHSRQHLWGRRAMRARREPTRGTRAR